MNYNVLEIEPADDGGFIVSAYLNGDDDSPLWQREFGNVEINGWTLEEGSSLSLGMVGKSPDLFVASQREWEGDEKRRVETLRISRDQEPAIPVETVSP